MQNFMVHDRVTTNVTKIQEALPMSRTRNAACISSSQDGVLHLIADLPAKHPLTVEECLYRIAALSAAILLLISLV